jgi:hypothetical protein
MLSVFIYLIRNEAGDPIYVGKTRDLVRRRREHRGKLKRLVELEVIETAGDDWQDREHACTMGRLRAKAAREAI